MTAASTLRRRPGRLNTCLASAACVAVGLLGATGCSDSDDDEPESSGVSAARVCDSTLDPRATAALERIAGVKEFKELTGTNEDGQPYRFALERAAEHLHDTSAKRSVCAVYKADDKSGKPLLEIDFAATNTHPKRGKPAEDDDLSFYPLGRYASTRGNLAANLFFTCASESSEGDTKYVKADMYSASDQLEPGATGKDRMVILNSVSRALAEQLGCADEARLPATVPDADDTP